VYRTIGLVASGAARFNQRGNGTGKEVVAEAIHLSGARSRLPMVTVNCAALPENLLEAELFGHVNRRIHRSANHRVGRFEQANGSTIFLDEIGDMPPNLQAKLLRVLQSGVSASRQLGHAQVDLRIIGGLECRSRQAHRRRKISARISSTA